MRRVAKPLPPAEFLHERFSYDPETGGITRRVYPGMRKNDAARYNGKPAGYINDRGYIQIGIGRRLVLAHRVIWKMVTNEEPPPEIDHKDGDPSNNRFANLRPATHQQNIQNKARWGRKGLPLGVYRMRKGFQAKIRIDGVNTSLGTYKTPEEAAEAYRIKSIAAFGQYARLSNGEG